MAPCFQRRDGIIGMAVRIGGDAGELRLQFLQRVLEGAANLIACQSIRNGNLGTVDERR
jgi:hypothetical protein